MTSKGLRAKLVEYMEEVQGKKPIKQYGLIKELTEQDKLFILYKLSAQNMKHSLDNPFEPSKFQRPSCIDNEIEENGQGAPLLLSKEFNELKQRYTTKNQIKKEDSDQKQAKTKPNIYQFSQIRYPSVKEYKLQMNEERSLKNREEQEIFATKISLMKSPSNANRLVKKNNQYFFEKSPENQKEFSSPSKRNLYLRRETDASPMNESCDQSIQSNIKQINNLLSPKDKTQSNDNNYFTSQRHTDSIALDVNKEITPLQEFQIPIFQTNQESDYGLNTSNKRISLQLEKSASTQAFPISSHSSKLFTKSQKDLIQIGQSYYKNEIDIRQTRNRYNSRDASPSFSQHINQNIRSKQSNSCHSNLLQFDKFKLNLAEKDKNIQKLQARNSQIIKNSQDLLLHKRCQLPKLKIVNNQAIENPPPAYYDYTLTDFGTKNKGISFTTTKKPSFTELKRETLGTSPIRDDNTQVNIQKEDDYDFFKNKKLFLQGQQDMTQGNSTSELTSIDQGQLESYTRELIGKMIKCKKHINNIKYYLKSKQFE